MKRCFNFEDFTAVGRPMMAINIAYDKKPLVFRECCDIKWRPSECDVVLGEDKELRLNIFCGNVLVEVLCNSKEGLSRRQNLENKNVNIGRYYARSFFADKKLTDEFLNKANYNNPIDIYICNKII